MQGFATNILAVTGITTSFAASKLIKLEVSKITDSRSVIEAPNSSYLSHVEVRATVTAGAPTTFQAALFWDAAGDNIIAGPSLAVDAMDALTTASTKTISIRVDLWPTAPSAQSFNGTVYLGLKTDAGTVTVPIGGAKLHWVARK